MGVASIIVIALMLCAVIHKMTPPDERRFLLIMFITAFLLRAVVAVLYQWYIDTWHGSLAFATDESYYLTMAWYKTLLLKLKDATGLVGKHASAMDSLTKEIFGHFAAYHVYKDASLARGFIYSFLLGLLYFIFGYSVLTARFFNILIGVSAILVVYSMTKSIFDKKIARLASICLIFLPAQIFLSISVIKDMLMIFSIILTLYLIVKTRNMKDFAVLLAPLALALYLVFKLLVPLFYFLAALFGISALIRMIDSKKRKILSFALVIVVLAAVFNIRTFINFFPHREYSALLGKHIGIAKDSDPTSYKLLPDRFYYVDYNINKRNKSHEIYFSKKGYHADQLEEAATSTPGIIGLEKATIEKNLFFEDTKRFMPRAFLKGLIYVLFKPFPWEARKITQALASVQMVIWYLVFPFVCIGLYDTFRHLTKDKLILIIFFFGLLFGMALSEGNVGALFRHRELISFAYVILGAAGLTGVFSWKKRVKL